HALSLPGFLLMLPDIYSETLMFNASPASSWLNIPYLWLYLVANMVTQYSCIMCVMILMSECTSLTVTLVLTIRKFISLIISIFYFQNPFTGTHWAATALVFAGSLLFMDLPVVNNRFLALANCAQNVWYGRRLAANGYENVITIKAKLRESDKSSESMGFIGKLFLLAIVVGFGAVLYQLFLTPDPPLPHIPELWFGKNALKPGEAIPKDPEAINKFTINVSDDVLNDLRRRDLSRAIHSGYRP
ncbi:unnamed protein product, partial [Medioppia subpectinata]